MASPGRAIAVGIHNGYGETVANRFALRVVTQLVGEADFSILEIDAGDG